MNKVKIIKCTMKKPLGRYKYYIGEVVEVIKEDGNTLIVKGKKGRFLVFVDDVERVN